MRNRRPQRPFRRRPPMLRRPQQDRGSRQLNPRLQRELQRANRLMNRGEHLNAAKIFLSLAEHAQDRGILRPASMLLLQTAHAYLLANRVGPAIKQARNGLKILASQQHWPALQREVERFALALEGEGRGSEADGLRAWANGLPGQESGPISSEGDQSNQPHLPEKCPFCGASMSLEQISSRDGQAAECRYCGSVVLPSQKE